MTAVIIVVGVVVLALCVAAVLTRGSALADAEMRWSTPLSVSDLREQGLDDLLQLMSEYDFALTNLASDELNFRRRHRPRWTIYAATVLYPVGAIALLRRKWIYCVVRLRESDADTRVVISGTMPAALRAALRGLFTNEQPG